MFAYCLTNGAYRVNWTEPNSPIGQFISVTSLCMRLRIKLAFGSLYKPVILTFVAYLMVFVSKMLALNPFMY